MFRRLLLKILHQTERLSEDFMRNLLSRRHPVFSVFAGPAVEGGQIQSLESQARDIARAKREDLRRDIEGKRKTIATRYGSLRSAMANEKLSPSARKSLNESCKTMEKGIDKLKAEIDQGDYAIAINTAMATMRKVYETQNEIEKANK